MIPYNLIVLIHVVCGSLFVVNLIILQYVVSAIMKRLPKGPVKKSADDLLEVRWRDKVGWVIILLALSAAGLAWYRWPLISGHPAYATKAILGSLSLVFVSLNHFWLRHRKRKLGHTPGKESEFEKLKRFSFWLEKGALAGAVGAAGIAWYMGHG